MKTALKAIGIAIGLFVLIVIIATFVGADQLANGATQEEVAAMNGSVLSIGAIFSFLVALAWWVSERVRRS